ncbi:hypothetical protein BJX63DRAFT_403710 [Aspergillus granulosus]|uniref:Uncharacterized protein n=1 Tax=Aspergillus granulosus TaxID=176169 RepID=A0ABR4H375_9EURO
MDKEGGNNLAGRSTAPDSLMVHTAGLKGFHYPTSFRVTLPLGREAGVMMEELYESAATLGYTLTGGSCKSWYYMWLDAKWWLQNTQPIEKAGC